jgi:hypothetical protein
MREGRLREREREAHLRWPVRALLLLVLLLHLLVLLVLLVLILLLLLLLLLVLLVLLVLLLLLFHLSAVLRQRQSRFLWLVERANPDLLFVSVHCCHPAIASRVASRHAGVARLILLGQLESVALELPRHNALSADGRVQAGRMQGADRLCESRCTSVGRYALSVSSSSAAASSSSSSSSAAAAAARRQW